MTFSKLQMSDWTQGSDSPLSNDKKNSGYVKLCYSTSLQVDITNTYKSVNDNGDMIQTPEVRG